MTSMAICMDIAGEIVRIKTMFSAFLVCCLFVTVTVQGTDILSVQSYMDILEGKSYPEREINNLDRHVVEEESQLDNEKSDTEEFNAPVGKLFTYSIPSILKGDGMVDIQILEAGLNRLPEWMDFDVVVNEILGVPSDEHIGNRHTIQITASNTSELSPVHAFSLNVVEDNIHFDTKTEKPKSAPSEQNKQEAIKCPSGSSVTSASVTVDVNTNNLIPKETAGIIRSLASHLGMPDDWLRIVPVGDRPMVDASALVAGQGDVNEAQTPGAFLQWVVGCGNVQGHHMPILQQLESTSGDGSMSQALGHGIIGWHVSNSRPASASTSHRMKRMARERSRERLSSSRRGRKKGSHRRNNQNKEDVEDENGSGFFGTPEEVEETPSPMPSESPTTPEKPRRTRRPRPDKTTGRHSHKTKHPPLYKGTVSAMMPTHVIVSTPTVLPESPVTKSSPGRPRSTKTTIVATTTTTPLLPTIVTTTMVVPNESSPTIPVETEDNVPSVENPIGRIDVMVGDILEFKVPKNTFKDAVDGNTRNLQLKMLNSDKHSVLPDSWIWFDEKSQTIFGMPLDYNIGESEYILMAANTAKKLATDTLTVKVERRPSSSKINHEFTVTFDLDYETFIANKAVRLEVIKKISDVYGDPDMSKITVTSVKPGSVEFSWTNNSLPTDTCPMDEIRHLLSFILTKENKLTQSFLDAMAPIKILGAGANPKGTCNVGKETPVLPPSTTPEKPFVDKTKTDDTDKFISTILPVIIIVSMIILACIIACCLYRRKRKGKLSDEDNSTFVTKGIPVIFAEELEDKPDPPTKPLIMSKERPPLPPPEYPKSTSGGSVPSSPGSGHSEPLLDHEHQDDPYTRPPPVAGSNGSMGRRLPKTPTSQQPGYRQPPPYTHVPP